MKDASVISGFGKLGTLFAGLVQIIKDQLNNEEWSV
jgi:hypothetical protein